jgi:hypothetical protein
MEGVEDHFKLHMPRKDGSPVRISSSTKPLFNNDDRYDGSAAMILDISGCKSGEQVLSDAFIIRPRLSSLSALFKCRLNVGGIVIMSVLDNFSTLEIEHHYPIVLVRFARASCGATIHTLENDAIVLCSKFHLLERLELGFLIKLKKEI